MNKTFSSSTTAPPVPSMHNFPAVPSYVVALCVVAGVVGTAMVLLVLYYCLVEKSKRRQKVGEDTHDRETEQLREEAVVECGPLGDSVLLTRQTAHVKPQPSPSIFSRGDFLMEVLEGVDDASDFSNEDITRVEEEVGINVCEADPMTVAFDELLEKPEDEELETFVSSSILHTPPSRESTNMAIFLENLETPILAPGDADSPDNGWDCTAVGLRVRYESYQGEASTAALRGSISSEQGEGGSEGEVGSGEVEIHEVTMDKVEINMDIVDKIDIYEDTKDNADNETKDKEHQNDEAKAVEDEVYVNFNTDVSSGESKLSYEQETSTSNVEENTSKVSPKSSPVFTMLRQVSAENLQFDDGNSPEMITTSPTTSPSSDASPTVSLLSDCSHDPHPVSPHITGVSSPHNLDTSSVTARSQSNPSIPVNIIPTSDQKVPLLNSPVHPSHSTQTTYLLSPQVSMLALPLTERAVSVSRLSLSSPAGTCTLPATPLSVSCDSTQSGYSPVYSMQFGSSRRLAVDSGDLNCARLECSEGDGRDINDDGGDANYPLEVEVVIKDDSTDLNPE